MNPCETAASRKSSGAGRHPAHSKVFQTGRSQAVRLPAAFRSDTKEVYIRRDEATGDVILSRRPGDWTQLFEAVDYAKAESQDFMTDRVDLPAQRRELY